MAASTILATRPIEAIWQERRELFRTYNADDRTFGDEALDRSYWDRIDQTEISILNHPDTGARATEIRLWVALWHSDDSNKNAVAMGDADELRRLLDLDWHEKLIFAAILNLRGENL